MRRIEPDFLYFASDAARLSWLGGLFLVLALVALAMERRRMRKARIDGVGWVPWTGLFVTFALLGGGMLVLALPAAIRG